MLRGGEGIGGGPGKQGGSSKKAEFRTILKLKNEAKKIVLIVLIFI